MKTELMQFHLKIGFIGVGNLAQAMIKGLVESKTVSPQNIFASNRSEGKLQKAVDNFGINSCKSNEELIEQVDVVVLAMKPQDMMNALDPISGRFAPQQIVISLAAGITLRTLEKKMPQARIIRLMANTPAIIRKGLFAFVCNSSQDSLATVIEDLCKPLGSVFELKDEDQLEAFMIACSSGPGFIFELMMYWQDWIEERGIDPKDARQMVVETFAGSSELALQSKEISIEDLQNKVTSKKGITAAGLQSIRELELERALRLSFEKAALRNQELAKQD